MVKIYKQPFAHDGDTIAIPDASQPDGKMSNVDGWTPDYQLPKTDPNYKPVGRQEMNGVFKEVTEAVGEIQQFGFAKWQPMQWPQGARVVEGGVVYRALTQTSQQPPHADWADESPIGMGQTWQNMTTIRALGTTYTNTTGRAIALSVAVRLVGGATAGVGGEAILFVNGIALGNQTVVKTSLLNSYTIFSVVVPPLGTYAVNDIINTVLLNWMELR